MAWQEGDIGFFDDLPPVEDLDDEEYDDVEELDFEEHKKVDWMEGYEEGD